MKIFTYFKYCMVKLSMFITLPLFISANTIGIHPKCPNGYTECIDFCDTNPDCKGDSWCANETRRITDKCIIPFYNKTNDIDYKKEEYLWILIELSFWSTFLFIFLIITGCVYKFVGPRQRFSTPLHGCGDDMGICCLVMWCPCIQWGKIAEWSLDDSTPWWCFCLFYFFCNDFRNCLGMVSRPAVRNKLGIPGEFWEDCLIHCFTHPCALCQEARELNVDSYGNPQIIISQPVIQPTIIIPVESIQCKEDKNLEENLL